MVCVGNGLFFESQGHALYGFLHPAEGGPRATGVVFVHGAFEERQDAHLVLRDAAAGLARQGFNVLRFDLFGHGDSAGEFADATLSHWVADTRAACETLRKHTGCQRVALVGLRLGALVAAQAAAALGEVASHLVLWQPVVSGRAYLLEALRAHLASEMVMHRRLSLSREDLVARLRAGKSVNLFGYHLAPALFAELERAELRGALASTAARTLVVDIVRNASSAGVPELDALVAALAERGQLARVVEPQSIQSEGKLFVTRAPQVAEATAHFLETVA